MSHYINRVRVAGLQQYGIEYFKTIKGKTQWHEIVVDAPEEEVALDRAFEKLKLEPIAKKYQKSALRSFARHLAKGCCNAL